MLSIVNNVYAVGARNLLTQANMMQAKSISRLASGLRINTAADDPSGLAISERLRAQINGLGRASMNAQDAISYFQTAEGALNETHTILQRMRELSVQAANGTLTASDRQTIQAEVDQLKQEVDRISTSTEFNTKKLLNGDAAALWSSSSDKVKGIIRGKVAEGNYALEINATPVENHVLKTDIFEVKDGLQSVDNVDLNGVKASVTVTLSTASATNVTFTFDDGTTRTFTAAASQNIGTAIATLINNDEILSKYIRAEVNTSASITLYALREGEYGNNFKYVDNGTGAWFASTSAQTFSNGKTSTTAILGVSDPVGLVSGADGTAGYTVSLEKTTASGTATSVVTGLAYFSQGISNGFTANSTFSAFATITGNVTTQAGGAYLMIEALETANITTATGSGKIRFSFDNGQTWTERVVNSTDLTASLTLTDGINSVNTGTSIVTLVMNKGDKILLALNDDENWGTNSFTSFKVTSPIPNGTTTGSTQVSREFRYLAGSVNNTELTFDVVQLDTVKGEWNVGSLNINTGEITAATSGTVTFDIESGGIATRNTELYKIGRFYDDDGNFILGQSGKYLTVYTAEGKSTDIYLDGGDTIGELADKINNAIKDELGFATGDPEVDKHIASFVSSGVPETDEALRGTIVIRSPKMGEKGRIYFNGDEDLMNALSLVTINDPAIDPITVTVKDAHTGEIIGSDTVSDNVLHNVIKGVDVEFDSLMDIAVKWDETHKKFTFESEAGKITEYIHVVDNAKSFQIGANEGQTMESFIGDMSGHALGIDRILVVNQEAAQNSITYVDEAIDRVSAERARMGAVINRLEHTINNLNVQQENAVASESRIRDLDLALESSELAKSQILSQAATSMLAQANQMAQGLLGLLRG